MERRLNDAVENATQTDLLVRLLGWRATLLHGDPLVLDRARWARCHLKAGPLRTLDAGCGNGAFTFLAARLGNEALGISFENANNRKAARRAALLGIPNAIFMEADLRELDRLRGKIGPFDQAICFETIEHILDDRKLAADLAALLKPGGRLLLTAPFRNCPPLRGDRISAYEDGGHVRRGYTHDEMRELLGAAGLATVVEDYVSGVVSQRLANLEHVVGGFDARLGWAATLPLRVFQRADRAITDAARRPYYSIAIVAEKPAH
jgi:SAM-dependent methyltransferase